MRLDAPILLYGADSTLLLTRAAMFRHEGFEVVTALQLDQLGQITQTRPISIMILCYTLSAEDQDKAIVILLWHRPGAKCVVLTSAFARKTAAMPALVVHTGGGSASLIRTVRKLAETHSLLTLHPSNGIA